MKKQFGKLASMAMTFAMIILLSSCEQNVTSPDYADENGLSEVLCVAEDIEVSDLTTDEEELLIFMREEEKLARDVYIMLYDKWGQKTFNNISNSEQQHTDAIKMLIEKYELIDPVSDDAVGAFENEELAELYETLINTGNLSLIDALKVGAAIEEIDILDLDEAIELTDNEDIILVYENLRKGSENHLSSFVKTLSRQGVEYEPQYLSQEQYDAIIN